MDKPDRVGFSRIVACRMLFGSSLHWNSRLPKRQRGLWMQIHCQGINESHDPNESRLAGSQGRDSYHQSEVRRTVCKVTSWEGNIGHLKRGDTQSSCTLWSVSLDIEIQLLNRGNVAGRNFSWSKYPLTTFSKNGLLAVQRDFDRKGRMLIYKCNRFSKPDIWLLIKWEIQLDCDSCQRRILKTMMNFFFHCGEHDPLCVSLLLQVNSIHGKICQKQLSGQVDSCQYSQWLSVVWQIPFHWRPDNSTFVAALLSFHKIYQGKWVENWIEFDSIQFNLVNQICS